MMWNNYRLIAIYVVKSFTEVYNVSKPLQKVSHTNRMFHF